ncbi:catalase family peroxidase [Stenotrophomonas sp. 24(2023)]|uniref:catalase family peroxidase n=1 Tax=Stenotrophomonas sp. 24(2023) TaxID=3068324 RepID=UPI0027E0F132|nr:catalase family peroxidase [Stenotrophomonas sp. 24(2023)]WMJ71362.1 catalase family peroxidase [Stenotrophomonas sp. 24(2023)]
MSLFRYTRAGQEPGAPRPTSPLLWIGLIALILGALALTFAWLAGWIGHRLTAQRFTDTIEATGANHPGFRRAHSKGVCVAGWFTPSPQAAALSSARVFRQARVPVLGRLSIGGGDPHGADGSARVRSIAVQLVSDDGQQWRMAMNSFPFFAVPTTEAFFEQTRAQLPDPATGKPDPAKMAAILDRYPSARAFQQWAKTAPWTDSWANTEFNSVNSFWFTTAQGERRAVRWRWQPQAAVRELDAAARAQADVDFLSADLAKRLAEGPVRWNLVVTLAGPGDAIDDPSVPWPATREQVTAGVLRLERMQPQDEGACGELNFDPLILPSGVEGSNDPILAARSAVYSQSFNRRERERASGAAAQPKEPAR